MKRLIVAGILGGMFGFGCAIAIEPTEPIVAIGVGLIFSSSLAGFAYILVE